MKTYTQLFYITERSMKLNNIQLDVDKTIEEPIVAKVVGIDIDHIKISDDTLADVHLFWEVSDMHSFTPNECYSFMYLEVKSGKLRVIF